MRDMWRRLAFIMTVIFCFSVSLCGCGINPVPESSKEKAGDAEVKERYVEKGVSLFPEHDIWPEESIRSVSFAMGEEGKMSQFVLRRDESDGVKTAYGKLVMLDGEWIKEDISWQESFDAMFEGKNVELQECYYSGDGWLYLYVMELEMSPEQEKSYEKEKEAAKKEKEETAVAPSYDVNRHNHLLRVDEKSGQITEMSIPEQTVEEVYGGDIPAGVRYGMAPEKFTFFENGNVLITNDGEINGIYSLPDGTLESSSEMSDRVSDVYAGDEFYCYAALNQKSGNVDVKVYDEDHVLQNTISTVVPFNSKGRTNIALGTKEDTIVMACEQGIFEAKWDGKSFEEKAGYETDQLYYLSPFSYYLLPGVYKGESEDYYTKMFEYDPNTEYFGGISPELIGYYSRKPAGEKG
ncbi:MAG: hypothetical protein NC293_08315 [Roseburia sp.]|nr:hypothetical protein [Roseburia sp.]